MKHVTFSMRLFLLFTLVFAGLLFLTFIPYAEAKEASNRLPVNRSGRWVEATVTAYSKEETCPNQTCINAAGKTPSVQNSVACPRRLQLGRDVRILNRGLSCDDRTAKRFDGRFDVFVGSYSEAIQFGKQKIMIFVYD